MEEVKQTEGSRMACSDDNIILNHIGHVGTVSEFEWNSQMPWSFISASDDSETFVQIHKQNEQSMQIFRPLSLLVQSEEDALD